MCMECHVYFVIEKQPEGAKEFLSVPASTFQGHLAGPDQSPDESRIRREHETPI